MPGGWRGGPGAHQGLHALVITTIDQATGTRHPGEEPMATLKRYRYDSELRGVVFARSAYAIQGTGSILARGQELSLE